MPKILLVDDEPDIREVYGVVLREEGYEVIEADDGEKALDMIQNEDWDLLLLDIMLPGLDGVKVLKNIKEMSGKADKPVILLSNLEEEKIIQRCLSLGAAKYIIKSNVTPSEIVSSVNQYLSNEI